MRTGVILAALRGENRFRKVVIDGMAVLGTAMAVVGYVYAEPSSEQFIYAYNEDDSHFFDKMPSERYERYLDSVCRGPVTHFLASPNSMRSNVDSKVFDPIWMALDEKDVKPDRRCAAGKWMHERGIDPYASYCKRGRERGISTWLSMRMNDIHSVTTPSYCALSRFWRKHPEFRRVTTPASPNGGANWVDYAFDYSHEEVRNYHVGYARELLGRYDLDGFEVDWLRAYMCLTPGKSREQSGCIDEVMRDIRKAADDASKRLGHRVQVAARVPSNIAVARELGFDVRTWVKEGLIDVIVPCNEFSSLDFRFDYSTWVSLKQLSPKLRIVVGADAGIAKEFLPYKAGGSSSRISASRAEYRGWAERLYAAGVNGVYFFNLFQHPAMDTKGVYNWVLDGGLLPERVAEGGKRVYVLTQCDFFRLDNDEMRRDPNIFGPLPCSLCNRTNIVISIGHPLPGARVYVRMAFDSNEVPTELAENVRLNGKEPVASETVPLASWIPKARFVRSSLCCEFSLDAVQSGDNCVELGGVCGGDAKYKKRDVMVYAVELELDDGTE